jgi:acyl dehydratase
MSSGAPALTAGDRRRSVVVEDLTRTQLVQYAGASGDYNPLHSDDVFAREVGGYPGVFAHGMLTMGLTGRVLTDWVGDDSLLEFGVRFVAQVWPGDTLTVEAVVRELGERDGRPVAEIDIVTLNQDGTQVMAGTAVARLDR